MIVFNNVIKQFSKQVLFTDLSFQINPGEKAGLVGPNGCGKTTPFRLIRGEEQPDEGSVSVPDKLSIACFRQELGGAGADYGEPVIYPGTYEEYTHSTGREAPGVHS
ncbi:MAG: ATP-binding cassette domain-containing protein [Acidobacteria bacterium]|nr:ATP-binding cassette domain-containing protein [Acidobacteriota bacterium]